MLRRARRLAWAVTASCLMACGVSTPQLDAVDTALHNRAVGLMGQYRNEDARLILQDLVERHPTHADLRTDLAIAMLNRQQDGDEERALAIAEQAIQLDTGTLRPRYVAGLAELYLGRLEQAAPRLRAVAEADPDDAHAAYFAGQALAQMGDEQTALALYKRALATDPYQRSAYYAAAQLLRKHGAAEEARSLLADYQALQGNPRAHLAEFRYTRMGAKATMAALPAVGSPRPMPRPEGPLFAEVEYLQSLASGSGSWRMSSADIDADGMQDLFISNDGQAWLLRGTDEGYRIQAEHPLGALDGVHAAAWGDHDNDGLLDVALCRADRPPELRSASTRWGMATSLPDVPQVTPCKDAQWLDIDHDGDIDLAVLGADGSSEIFGNNLNGSFRRLSAQEGAAALSLPRARGWMAGDLDADRDLDLLAWQVDGGLQVMENDRLWQFHARPLPTRKGTQAVTLADPAATGRPIAIAIDDQGRLAQLDPQRGSWTPIGNSMLGGSSKQLVTQDFDGDGAIDLLVHDSYGLEIWRFAAGGKLDLMRSESLSLHALIVVHESSDRGPSLLGVSGDGASSRIVRWSPGPGRHRFLSLLPGGRSGESEGMRSNASGLGTRVVLRRGDRYSVEEFLDRASTPGQSLQPMVLGLGDADAADFVELQWSDGVLQTELDLAAGTTHPIAETQRQLASCPVLFAWNGERFAFVSDLLGVGGIGFLLAPGEYAPPRPWEFFRLPDDLLQSDGALLRLQIAEPMEEVAYLDQVRLHVYDLPPGWNLTLDERMGTGAPAPTGEALYYQDDELIEFSAARTAREHDVLESLRVADGQAVDPGPVDPRFLGRLEQDLELELELPGDRRLEADSAYALLARGWVEYPYSQTLFAAWQAGADYRPFSLDTQDAQGWRTVHPTFGYPAGMPREMALPLPRGVEASNRLRLRGNLEVYWDRLAMIRTHDAPAEATHRIATLAAATVRRIGFPKRAQMAQKRPDYDHADRSPFWDTRYPEGEYSAFGVSTALVASHDDAFAIIGPGDALELAFDAPAAAPAGWRRIYVLESRGYAKDMDLYTGEGGTISPLPRTPGIESTAEAKALHEHHNQRFQAGF